VEPQAGDDEVRWFSFDPDVWVEREHLLLHPTTAETSRDNSGEFTLASVGGYGC